jgi:hypothetical protein
MDYKVKYEKLLEQVNKAIDICEYEYKDNPLTPLVKNVFYAILKDANIDT